MKIKFEPQPDITALELALILKSSVPPFATYSECPVDTWEEFKKIEVGRHFKTEGKYD